MDGIKREIVKRGREKLVERRGRTSVCTLNGGERFTGNEERKRKMSFPRRKKKKRIEERKEKKTADGRFVTVLIVVLAIFSHVV